jgi:hypothetical protein
MANASEERHLVLLETHARASAEPEPAPGQLGLHLFFGERQARREALDHDDERPAMGLTGGKKAQHEPNVLVGSPTSRAL